MCPRLSSVAGEEVTTPYRNRLQAIRPSPAALVKSKASSANKIILSYRHRGRGRARRVVVHHA
jgi:hypothetical protein